MSTRPPAHVRLAHALAMANGIRFAAARYSESQWGAADAVTQALAVAVTPTGDDLVHAIPGAEFTDAVRARSVVGRIMASARRVPFLSRVTGFAVGTSAHWIGRAKPIPVSRGTLAEPIILAPTGISSIAVVTDEIAKLSRPGADSILGRDLVAAAAESMDTAFLDPSIDGDDEIPPSVIYGAPSISSSGPAAEDITEDLRQLFALLADTGSQFAAPFLVMSPRNAVALSLLRDGGGPVFPGTTVAGGDLGGVPVIASSAAEDRIVVFDAAELLVADDGRSTLEMTTHADLEMSTAPTQDGSEGTGAEMVSLWQAGLTGFRIVRYVHWRPRRPVIGAFIEGVDLLPEETT